MEKYDQSIFKRYLAILPFRLYPPTKGKRGEIVLGFII